MRIVLIYLRSNLILLPAPVKPLRRLGGSAGNARFSGGFGGARRCFQGLVPKLRRDQDGFARGVGRTSA